jgi:hypothetical protein
MARSTSPGWQAVCEIQRRPLTVLAGATGARRPHRDFLYRTFLLGDRAVAGSGFAPLPIETQARIVASLSAFRTTDGRVLPVLGGLESQSVIAMC